jgi:hypothetical protein
MERQAVHTDNRKEVDRWRGVRFKQATSEEQAGQYIKAIADEYAVHTDNTWRVGSTVHTRNRKSVGSTYSQHVESRQYTQATVGE